MIIIICILVLAIYGKKIINFLKEKDFEHKCKILNIDSGKLLKKRRIEMILLFIVAYFVPLDYQKYFLVVIFVVYKQAYWKLNQNLNQLKKDLNLQFSIWLRIMEVLLNYHTVVLSIEASIEDSPKLMQHHLQDLVEKLKDDPLDRDVYLNFMSDYESLNIERSMHHLYRYAVMGSTDANVQLTNLIEENAKELIEVRRNLFDSRLNFYSWFGLVPMLLVSLSFLGLMFMVLTNLMKGGWSI